MTPEQTTMYFDDSDGTLEFDSVEEMLEWRRTHGQ
jgi:hypothetical protein